MKTNASNCIKIARIFIIGLHNRSFVYKSVDIDVNAGDLVLISFRKQPRHGICWSTEVDTVEYFENINAIKISKVLPVQSIKISGLLSEEMRNFLEMASSYNMIAMGSLLRLVLPDNLLKMTKKDVSEILTISPSAQSKIAQLNSRSQSSMQKIVDAFAGHKCIERNILRKMHSISALQIKKAIQQNIIDIDQNEVNHFDKFITTKDTMHSLNHGQYDAVQSIIPHLNNFAAILLHGVTGSGKTEVYCHALKSIMTYHPCSQILIMLPEISLTTSLVDNLSSKFGILPIVWHSSISGKKRNRAINDIMLGKACIIVGARSAIFLPYKNLRCIVVDEEHDQSYKQNESPVYNARDMAILKGKIENFPVILSSATPSIESYYNAIIGKYHLIKIASRFGSATMPNIIIVDLNKDKITKKTLLSSTAISKMKNAIELGQQVLIFLNRRGYARMLICKSCGHSFQCPNCDNQLSYHKLRNVLQCHYCNFRQTAQKHCIHCNNSDCFDNRGPGIERIAEEVKSVIGEKAKIIIISSDTINDKHTIDHHLHQITSGAINVIIGTQIVSKGHNFPNLSLVIVVDMDMSAISGDFRIMERLYQLLTQVSGRAGRSDVPGEVIIQTYNPRNKALQAIADGKQDEFYKLELNNRYNAKLPPCTHQIAIVIAAEDELLAKKCAQDISRNIGIFFTDNAKYRDLVRVLGPIESVIYYLKRRYRYRILLQSNKVSDMQKVINSTVCSQKISDKVQIKIDVDPHSIL